MPPVSSPRAVRTKTDINATSWATACKCDALVLNITIATSSHTKHNYGLQMCPGKQNLPGKSADDDTDDHDGDDEILEIMTMSDVDDQSDQYDENHNKHAVVCLGDNDDDVERETIAMATTTKATKLLLAQGLAEGMCTCDVRHVRGRSRQTANNNAT